MTLLSTGIPPLDLFLRGGLPRGFTMLLVAPTGAGAEIFAKQFAANHKDEAVTYITSDESVGEVEETVRLAGWDFAGVTIVDLQTQFADAMLEAQQKARAKAPGLHGFDPRELVEGTSSLDMLRAPRPLSSIAANPVAGTDYLGRLLDPFAQGEAPDRMVVHSLDFFLNLYPVEQVVSVLTALKAANARQGGLLLMVLAKGAHGGVAERRLELLADCLVELEMARKGTSFERFLLVKKVKNRSTGIGVSTYEVTPQGFHLETLERIH